MCMFIYNIWIIHMYVDIFFERMGKQNGQTLSYVRTKDKEMEHERRKDREAGWSVREFHYLTN